MPTPAPRFPCLDLGHYHTKLVVSSVHLTYENYRLAKAGHPETLNAGLHMVKGSIPMLKGMVGKMMENNYSQARIVEVQAELTRDIQALLNVQPLYIPWTVTVGRKP